MFRFAVTAIFLSLISSCVSVNKSPSYTVADLVGTWELKFDGNYPYWFSQIGFTEDGRKCVLSYEFDAQGNVSIDYYLNRFTIKNGNLVTEVTFSSTPYLPKGYIIKDRIDVLKANYFEVFMVQPEGTTAEKHQRLIDVSPEDVCKVIESYRITKKLKTDSAEKRRNAA